MRSTIAAALLALVSVAVTIGTIWTAGEADAYCLSDEPCEVERPPTVADAAGDWERATGRFLFQVEQGFQYMAGAPY